MDCFHLHFWILWLKVLILILSLCIKSDVCLEHFCEVVHVFTCCRFWTFVNKVSVMEGSALSSKSHLFPHKFSTWPPCGTGGGSVLRYKPRLFLHKLSIWPPCGTVLTGGIEGSALSCKPHLFLYQMNPFISMLSVNFDCECFPVLHECWSRKGNKHSNLFSLLVDECCPPLSLCHTHTHTHMRTHTQSLYKKDFTFWFIAQHHVHGQNFHINSTDI